MYKIYHPVDTNVPHGSIAINSTSDTELDWGTFGPNTVVELTTSWGSTIIFDNRPPVPVEPTP